MRQAARFVCTRQEIWRPHRGVATQLVKAICACRFEANQDWKTISHFECGMDLSLPTVAAQRSIPHHHHSSFAGIWNWGTCYDGDVAPFVRATDPRLETRLVTRRSWDWQRNSCFG